MSSANAWLSIHYFPPLDQLVIACRWDNIFQLLIFNNQSERNCTNIEWEAHWLLFMHEKKDYTYQWNKKNILGASTALVKAKLLFDLVLQVIGLADPFPLNDFNNCLWSCPRAKMRLKTSNEMANLNFTKSYSCHVHQFFQLSTYLLVDSVTIMILLPSLVGIIEVFIYGISKFLIQTWKINDKKNKR